MLATRLRPTARRRALSTLVDLAAYPINRLDSHGGQLLLRHCHKLSEQDLSLSGFLTPVAMLDEAKSLSAENGFYSTESHNVFLGRACPMICPNRTAVNSSSKLLFAADQLSSHSPLRECAIAPFARFIRAITAAAAVFSVDPMAVLPQYLLGRRSARLALTIRVLRQPRAAAERGGGAFGLRPRRAAVSAQCALSRRARRAPAAAARGQPLPLPRRDSLHRVGEVRQGERINAIPRTIPTGAFSTSTRGANSLAVICKFDRFKYNFTVFSLVSDLSSVLSITHFGTDGRLAPQSTGASSRSP